MDHLPLPRDPTIGTLDVPFLGSEDYDGGSFLTYYQRNGWSIERPVKQLQAHITFKHDGTIITDERKLAGFLQTWLYFGMLSEAIGTKVEAADFQRPAASGEVFLSSAKLYDVVKSWSERFLEGDEPKDVSEVQAWAIHLQGCMELAGNITSGLASSWQGYATLLNTGLAIAALCEYLQSALNDMLGELNKQLPGLQLTPRLSWRTEYGDCGQPLVERMIELGWCPARMMYLNNQQTNLIGLLWYFANLRPPSVEDNHANCTKEQCMSLQIDLKDYQTAHVDGECNGDCGMRGPPDHKLAELVTHDTLPLTTVWRNSDDSDTRVKVQACTPDTEFIAISHVWADGMGNRDANSLPPCVLFKLQCMLNEAPRSDPSKQMPFWLDTLCLPVAPKDLRKKALEQMNEPYRKAQWVIVIDAYLRETSLEDMDPLEMLVRIIASGWHQRLWTFAEGRLGKNVCFLFKDKLVNLPYVLQPWASRKRPVPTPPYDEVLLTAAWTYTASSLMPESMHQVASFRGIPALRGALNTRTTSRASDEALCLGIILELQLKPIIDADDDEKMVEFWKQLEKVPTGLAFSHATSKLNTHGYRWAPKSFIGQSQGRHWGGPSGLFTRIEGRVTKEGLTVCLPGWTFNTFDETADSLLTKCNFFHICELGGAQAGLQPYIFGPYGRWYVCATNEQWHQNPASIDYEEEQPALILETEFEEEDVTPQYSAKHEQELQYGKIVDALLVTYKELKPSQSPIHVKVHRHVRIQPISSKEQQQYTLLQACANEIFDRHAEKVQDLRCTPIDFMDSPEWLIEFMFNYFQETPELMQSGRETQAFKNYGTSDPVVMTVFTRIVHYLIIVGDWCKVEPMEQPVQWCVD